LRGRRKGFRTLPKGIPQFAFPKTMACVGHFQKICKDACRGAGAVQETCSSEMFFRFAKMILRDRCSTSYDLASLLRSMRNTSETWTWTGKNQNALVGVRQLCAQLSIVLEETRSHTLEMIQIFILSFFCVVSSFHFCLSFVWSFVLSFFCRFSFVCHVFVVFLSFQFWPVFFFWSFGGTFVILFAIVGHVRAIFSKIWKTIEKLPKK